MTTVCLKRNRDKSLRQRHPWVFSGAIASVDGEPAPGEVVRVTGSDGGFLGQGYFNAASNIRVRMLEWDEDRAVDDQWWRDRITGAVGRRARLAADDRHTAYRLVHAEADLLPGLIVDRYGDYLVVQFLTAGVERAREVIADALMDATGATGVLDRSDGDARRKEGMRTEPGVVAGTSTEMPYAIRENGHTFVVDLDGGQKTGFYLDQRDNRVAVAGYANGRTVLDGFAYSGAFAVNAMAGGAASVTVVDSSAPALSLAEQNLESNGADMDSVELIDADVADLLRHYRDDGRRFGMVILDPPKFARTHHQAEKALRAYKDVNMMAMKTLEPAGILASFSCSGGIDADAFTMAVAWAALDAGRDVQILRRLGQGADHPVLASFPESEYLKGIICRVL